MRIRTQPAGVARPMRRTVRLAAFAFLLIWFGLIRPAAAQEDGNRAGLVIQFGDGSVRTVCVDLGPSGQATGEEMVRASGLATLIDYSSGFGGGTVCKIGNQGCDFPAAPCFCQCTMKPGDPCAYWSYFHLVDGQWRYSNQSLSSHVVGSGDVEAWVWGLGSPGSGVNPPAITFEQICSAPAAETLPSPTTKPSLPAATSTSPATLTPTVPRPSATSLPTHTAVPSATAMPSPTQPPPSTNTPLPETPVPSPQPSVIATHTLTPSVVPSDTPTVEPTTPATRTATLQAAASLATGEQPASVDSEGPLSASSVQEEKGAQKTNYVVFGALVLILIGALVFLRVR